MWHHGLVRVARTVWRGGKVPTRPLPFAPTRRSVAHAATHCWPMSRGDTVCVLHGLFATRLNATPLVWWLRAHGWAGAEAWGYDSRAATIHGHAQRLVAHARDLAARAPGRPIHFVGHSMGGLVVRASMSHPDCPAEARAGRVVLLAPPNRGSAWARHVAATLGPTATNLVLGDQAGSEMAGGLGRDASWFAAQLGRFPEGMPVLVIAGTANLWNPVLPRIANTATATGTAAGDTSGQPQPRTGAAAPRSGAEIATGEPGSEHESAGAAASDGTVMVHETRLDTPHEFRTLAYGHTALQWAPATMKAVVEFLDAGVEA